MENSKDIRRLEVLLSILLVFIPLILKGVDGEFRSSISNYAYSNFNYVFAFLLTLAGSMFLYNGVGYKRHWYNSVLGISLFGVVLTPHLDYPVWHYIFASIFFIGSILAIQLSSNISFRSFKNIISIMIISSLLLHFFTGVFSLLVAEWIGIIPISLHFILKSLKCTKK